MATRILIRRGTYAEWVSANPVLKYGEISYDLTNNKVKVGDGVTPWLSLDYLACDGMEPQLVGGSQIIPFTVSLDCSRVGNTASVMIPEGYVGFLSTGNAFGYMNYSSFFNGYTTPSATTIVPPTVEIKTSSFAWGGSATNDAGVMYVKNIVTSIGVSQGSCSSFGVAQGDTSAAGSLIGGYPMTFTVSEAISVTGKNEDYVLPYALFFGYIYLIKNDMLASAVEIVNV